MASAKPEVGILMGSDSDWPVLKETVDTLRKFGVACEVSVMSAHRTPALTAEYAAGAAGRGIRVLIAAAGGAAHLAGVIAAHTTLPVIGIPVKGGALNGIDALLATLQMPAGIPVATVTLGSAGPVNAAILAVQILALGRADLQAKLLEHKRNLEKKVKEGHQKVQLEMGTAG